MVEVGARGWRGGGAWWGSVVDAIEVRREDLGGWGRSKVVF